MKPVRNYLTEEEVERVLVRDAPIADKVLIQVGLSLGCRVSEITHLRLKHINGRTVRIWDEKKDEYRVCVLDPETADLLANYLHRHYKPPTGYTRSHRLLFYWSTKTINRRIKETFAKAEVSDEVPWRWHTLRHTYVRRMLDRMGDRAIQFICEQTGDAPATILAYYGVPSLQDRLKAAEDYAPVPKEVD